jgi:hypothetical protein
MPRYFGQRATPQHPVNPDTILTKLLTAATAESFDFPPNTDLFRLSCGSTAAGFHTVFLNMGSTKAALPTTAHGISTQGSSQFNIPVSLGEGRVFQLARGTTNFSLIAVSSMYVCMEFWTRAGVTST